MSRTFTFELDGEVVKATNNLSGVNSTVELEDSALALALAQSSGTQSGVLPPAVRWMSPKKRVILFERPPQVVDISYYGMLAGKITRTTVEQVYSLPIPWTIYVVKLNYYMQPYEIHLYARPEAMESLDDPLYILPLANLYRQGKFCIPVQKDLGIQPDKFPTIAQSISRAYQLVWNSSFNLDITECIDDAYRTKSLAELFERVRRPEKISGANLYKAWSSFDVNEVLSWEGWNRQYAHASELVGTMVEAEAVEFNTNYLMNFLRGIK